jgi:hypothetical protein
MNKERQVYAEGHVDEDESNCDKQNERERVKMIDCRWTNYSARLRDS